MADWTRKPEETPGTHRFARQRVATSALLATIDRSELYALNRLLDQAIVEHDGLDYLQVFESDSGLKVWVIDDGSYVTWMLPSDY